MPPRDEPEPTDADFEFWAWLSDPEADPYLYVETADGWLHRDEVHTSRDGALVATLDTVVRRAIQEAGIPAAPRAVPTASEFESVEAFAKRLAVDRKTIERRVPEMAEGTHYLRIGRRVTLHIENAKAFFAGREVRASKVQDDLLAAFEAKRRRK